MEVYKRKTTASSYIPSSSRRHLTTIDHGDTTASNEEMTSRNWCMPFSTFRRKWEFTLFLLSLFVLIQLPIFMFFHQRIGENLFFWVIHVGMDIFFLANLYLRTRKFFIECHDSILTEPHEIIPQHLGTCRFLYDVIGAIPCELIHGLVFSTTASSTLCNLLGAFRASNFLNAFKYLKMYLEHEHGAFNSSLLSMTKVFLVMLVLLNVFACALLKLGCPSYPCSKENSWIFIYNLEGEPFEVQLLHAQYIIAQTIFTVGYGDYTPQTNVEKMFINMVMLIGVFLYALLIAIMTSVIANQDATGMEFKNNLEKITDVLQVNRISSAKTELITQYFEYLNSRQGGKPEAEILSILPEGIAQEQNNLIRELIETTPLFSKRHFTPRLLSSILASWKPRTYPIGSVIAYAVRKVL